MEQYGAIALKVYDKGWRRIMRALILIYEKNTDYRKFGWYWRGA